MKSKKFFALLTLSVLLTFCLTATAGAAMSDEDFAVGCGYHPVQEIQTALQEGANPNAKNNKDGSTALMYAVHNQNPEVISLLLKAGAEVNTKDFEGMTALMCAAQFSSNPEFISFLLKAGADVDVKDHKGRTAMLIAAMSNNNPEVISLLLKAGADVNDNAQGVTALMGAASYSKNPEVLLTLLKAGADVNAKNNNGETALMLAAGFNHNPEILSTLLEAGANPNEKFKNTWTALDIARKKGNWSAVNVLEAAGDKVTAEESMEDEDGFFSLCEWGSPKEIRAALEAGADVNAKNDYGMTVLMWAAGNNPNPEVLSLLLKAGADVNAKDDDGKTALDYARESNNDAAVKVLEGRSGVAKPAVRKGQQAANATIAGDKVNVRSKPNTSSRVVKQLNTGHPITIIRQEGDWYLIRTASGTEGWVLGKFVAPGETAAPKKTGASSKAMSDEEYLRMKKDSPAFAKADKELNQAWKEAQKALGKSDFNKLKESQKKWISQGRDAAAKQYIDDGMSRTEAYTAATEDRVQELRKIVKRAKSNS